MKSKITNELKTRFFKLYHLAERGEGGEKETAKTMLDRFLKANDLKINEFIVRDIRKQRSFIIQDDFYEIRLFCQTCCEYEDDLNNKINMTFMTKYGVRKCKMQVSLTEQAYITIENKYAFYLKQWREQLAAFYTGFVMKYNIYAANGESVIENDLSKEDLERLELAAKMSKTINKEEYHIALEEKSRQRLER